MFKTPTLTVLLCLAAFLCASCGHAPLREPAKNAVNSGQGFALPFPLSVTYDQRSVISQGGDGDNGKVSDSRLRIVVAYKGDNYYFKQIHSNGATTVTIHENGEQYSLQGDNAADDRPKTGSTSLQLHQTANPLSSSRQYSTLDVNSALRDKAVHRSGVEDLPGIGKVDVYAAQDFQPVNGVHISGVFKVLPSANPTICYAEEKTEAGKVTSKTKFVCESITKIDNYIMPDKGYREMTVVVSGGKTTKVREDFTFVEGTSDVPDSLFHVNLPPNSRLADAETGMVWRINEKGERVVDPLLSRRKNIWPMLLFIFCAAGLILTGIIALIRRISARRKSATSALHTS